MNDAVPEDTLAFLTNGRSRMVVQPLLIATLVASLFTGILLVLRQFTVFVPWLATIPLIFLICLEGIYTTLWLYHPSRWVVTRLDYRAAEVVFLVVCVRLVTWGFYGSTISFSQIFTYLRHPLIFFDDLFFVFTLILSLLAWAASLTYANIFNALAISPGEAAYYSLPASEQKNRPDQRPLRLNRAELVTNLTNQWLWGGILLIFCASLTTLKLPGASFKTLFTLNRVGLPREMLILLIIYFIAGFCLLSQARLASLNARWLADGANKGAKLERNWQRYSLWLLGLIALVAAFLPIGSTTGIGRLADLILFIILLLVNLVIALFAGLAALFLSLFPRVAPTDYQPPPPLSLDRFVPPAVTPPPANDMAGILFSSLFWAIALVMTTTAVLFFLRDRGVRVNRPLVQSLWDGLVQWWRNWWRGVSAQVRDIRQSIQGWVKRPSSPTLPAPPWRFIRLNALSPREQIRYFYLAIVRRASEQGVPRQAAETPLEFTQDLKQTWPDAEADVETLTEAFLRARYTPQPIEKQDVNPVKEGWKRVKSSLRKRKKGHEPG